MKEGNGICAIPGIVTETKRMDVADSKQEEEKRIELVVRTQGQTALAPKRVGCNLF